MYLRAAWEMGTGETLVSRGYGNTAQLNGTDLCGNTEGMGWIFAGIVAGVLQSAFINVIRCD